MQPESTQLISRCMSRDLQWSMKLKLLMDTFQHQEVRQPQSAVATRQQRCVWPQEMRQKHVQCIYTHLQQLFHLKKSQEKLDLRIDLKVLAQATLVDNPP